MEKKESVKNIFAKKLAAAKKGEIETVTNGKSYWKPEKKGDVIEGLFLRIDRTVGAKYGVLEKVEGKTKKVKVSYNGVLETEKGEISLPSTGMLNDFCMGDEDKEDFPPLKEGQYIRITFLGKKLKKDKKEGDENSTYNDYTLERAKI